MAKRIEIQIIEHGMFGDRKKRYYRIRVALWHKKDIKYNYEMKYITSSKPQKVKLFKRKYYNKDDAIRVAEELYSKYKHNEVDVILNRESLMDR